MTYPQLVDHKNCSLLKPERRDFMQLVETRGFDLSPLFLVLVEMPKMSHQAKGKIDFIGAALIIACIVKTRERFMGIGQVMTMPIFFASNAIYPLSLMPDWLKAVSHVNPLTYEVDALRGLMLKNAVSDYGLALDFAILVAATAALTAIAARLYSRLGY